MPQRIFGSVQVELPFELGPPDGRFPLREQAGGQIGSIVVLRTLPGAPRAARAAPEPKPVTVPVTQATVIDTQALAEGEDAEAWLRGVDVVREQGRAFASLNRLLAAHRIATANPYVHEVDPSQALAIRIGVGEGEQVADGRLMAARELAPAPAGRRPRGRRRRAALAAQQESRLAALLGARTQPLLCEELALRARLDLDQGRSALAALSLERAYAAALAELAAGAGAQMTRRVGELRGLADGVRGLAVAVIDAAERSEDSISKAQADTLGHALARLEAALRARALLGQAR